MNIIPVASGSSGNCYLAAGGHRGKDMVLLDCGIPLRRIQAALWERGKGLPDLQGCLVTHAHGDHVKSAQKLADRGVRVHASQGTIEAAGLQGPWVHTVKRAESQGSGRMEYLPFRLRGGAEVQAFPVEHDAPEPLGFVLTFPPAPGEDGRERLVYVTDAPVLKYRIPRVTHLMIEANYDPDVMLGNASEGAFPASHAKRVAASHMSIGAALLALSRMDLKHLKEVWLLHLSDDNAGADFKERAQEVCGCPVYIA